MFSNKKKGSKSSKKQTSNIQTTPPPNLSSSLDPNAYHPMMFSPTPDEPMFSPSQNQLLANLVYNLSQNQSPFPTSSQNVFNAPSENVFTTPSPPSQVSGTQFSNMTPRRLLAEETDEEEEEEEEEAEQEEEMFVQLQQQQQQQQQPQQQGRKKGKGKVIERTKAEPWKLEEVIALAQTWVDISEDAAQGNNQDTKVFQMRIWKAWCERMGRTYRTHQSIYSKWRNTSKIAKDFEAIYNQVERNWRSGANSEDIKRTAREQYVDKNGTKNAFNLQAEAFWSIVRDSEKWKNKKSFNQFATGLQSSKRSKTSESSYSQSSDANIGFDMNAEPEDEVLPMGRDQAKRKMRGGSSTTISSQHSAYLQKLDEKVAELKTLHTEKLNVKLMQLAMQEINHLTGIEYHIALQTKKDAAKKLGYTLLE